MVVTVIPSVIGAAGIVEVAEEETAGSAVLYGDAYLARFTRSYGISVGILFGCLVDNLHKLGLRIVSETCEEDVYGGFLRAPISLSNNYGNFWFYSQHLVQMACEVFGYRPVSVFAVQNGKTVTVSLNYGKYTVSLEYVDGNYKYFAYASTKDGMKGGALNRVLDFEAQDGDIFEDFNEVINTVTENYGFAAHTFVLGVIKKYDSIKGIINDFEQKIKDFAEKQGHRKEGKQVIPLAVLLAADQLAEEILFQDGVHLDLEYCI